MWIILLALVPTSLYTASPSSNRQLHGLWYDVYSGIQLEIKHHRKGIKAREIRNYRNKKKWRTFYRMGRGVFDDCDGRVIIANGYGEITYRTGRRRSYRLTRERDYGYDAYDYRRNERWYDRDYDDYGSIYGDYDRDRRRGRDRDRWLNNRDRYCGDWHCSDHDLYLQIEAYRDGFRARRRGGGWTYYNPWRNGQYRDRRGNTYYFDDGYLTWQSRDRKRRFRFKKR